MRLETPVLVASPPTLCYVWQSVSPDPNLLLGLPEGVRADPGVPVAEIMRRRRTSMSPALSLSYSEPLHIVRGEGAHLVDAAGRPVHGPSR